MHQLDGFRKLIQSVESGNNIAIKKAYINVNLHIAETITAIEEKQEAKYKHESQLQELVDAVKYEIHYRDILTVEYLNRIYQSTKIKKELTIF